MKQVIVVVGAGSIGQAIARRVSAGKHVLLADLQPENAEAVAKVLSDAGFETSITVFEVDAEAASAQPELADAATDRFIAVLSHELRNPLASISTAAELMASHKLGPELREEAIQVLRRQAQNMKRLMDDLLDISRLTQGHFTLDLHPTLLATVVKNAVEATRPQFDAVNHVLTVDMPGPQATVNADLVRLTQVVSNLLGNAAKYTLPGGTIHLTCEVGPHEACIVVKDSGVGLKAADIDSMFDMFTQGGNTGEFRGGLGIGLSLARTIVEMHGGHITASSAGINRGSEFRVTLPLMEAPLDMPTPREERRKHRRAPGQVIVVADDNIDGAWSLSELLTAAGHTVHLAHNGQQALQQIEIHRPSVAVLDIGMPLLDGYEVAKRVRQQARGQNVMLIAATGWGQDSDQQKARQAGFNAHLTKPVDYTQLHQLIDSVSVTKTRRM